MTTASSIVSSVMAIRFDDIGNRLKAFRLGSGLSADEIAQPPGNLADRALPF